MRTLFLFGAKRFIASSTLSSPEWTSIPEKYSAPSIRLSTFTDPSSPAVVPWILRVLGGAAYPIGFIWLACRLGRSELRTHQLSAERIAPFPDESPCASTSG